MTNDVVIVIFLVMTAQCHKTHTRTQLDLGDGDGDALSLLFTKSFCCRNQEPLLPSKTEAWSHFLTPACACAGVEL